MGTRTKNVITDSSPYAGEHRCHFCKKNISKETENQYIAIGLIQRKKDENNRIINQRSIGKLRFHKDCFSSVAGPDYINEMISQENKS